LGYLKVDHRPGLTSISTLLLPVTRVSLVTEKAQTSDTGVTQTLKNSDGEVGVLDDAAHPSRMKIAHRWLINAGHHLPPKEREAELRALYKLNDDQVAELMALATAPNETAC
jgi:hypothetical protein